MNRPSLSDKLSLFQLTLFIMKNKDPVYLTKKRPEVLQHYPTVKVVHTSLVTQRRMNSLYYTTY